MQTSYLDSRQDILLINELMLSVHLFNYPKLQIINFITGPTNKWLWFCSDVCICVHNVCCVCLLFKIIVLFIWGSLVFVLDNGLLIVQALVVSIYKVSFSLQDPVYHVLESAPPKPPPRKGAATPPKKLKTISTASTDTQYADIHYE